jgi:hypothetical protein
MRGLEIPPGAGAYSASALYALGAAIAAQAKAGAAQPVSEPAQLANLAEDLSAIAQAPESVKETIARLLAEAMERSVRNGASSVSMPDGYVALAGWLAGLPAPKQVGGTIGHAAEPAAELALETLTAAAEKHASAYAGDDRECIVTDVLNAFYAGAKYAAHAQEKAAATRGNTGLETVGSQGLNSGPTKAQPDSEPDAKELKRQIQFWKDACDDAHNLGEELAAPDRQDAKRWRWLADDMNGDAQREFLSDLHRCVYGRGDLEKKADAAMKAKP